jgi:hypothetical protein
MTKRLLGLCALLIAGFFLIYSCKKSDSIQVEEQETTSSLPSFINPKYPMNTRLARRYYNQLVREQGDEVKHVTSNQARKDEVNKKQPIWNKAYEGSTDSSTFIEVPLAYNRRSSSIIKSNKESIKPEDEKKLLNGSFDRLFISKNKVTGEVTQFIINYLPSLEYLNKHNGDASSNHIDKFEKDFSGLLQYKYWDGTPFLLYKVEGGKVVRKFKNFDPQKGKSSNAEARLVCVETEQWCNVTWEQTCYSGGSGEDYWSGCTDWEITSVNYCWDECIRWEDDGTTDPGDSGGGCDGCPTEDPNEVCRNNIQELFASGAPAATKLGVEEYFNDGNIRKKNYKWKVYTYSGGSFLPGYLISTEKSEQTKNSAGAWKFSSWSHKDVVKDGVTIGYEITLAKEDADAILKPHLGVADQVGYVHLDMVVRMSAVCNGFPLASEKPAVTENQWHVSE